MLITEIEREAVERYYPDTLADPIPETPPRVAVVGDVVAVRFHNEWMGPTRVTALEGERTILTQPMDAPADCLQSMVHPYGYGSEHGQWHFFTDVPVLHPRAVPVFCGFVLRETLVRGALVKMRCGRAIDVPRAFYERSLALDPHGYFHCGVHSMARHLGPGLPEGWTEEQKAELEQLLGADP